MTTAESRRHDIYTGLTEFLGPDRADTLMTYLPSRESTDLATKADLTALELTLGGRIDRIDGRLDNMDRHLVGMNQRLESVDQRFEAVNERLDRIVLTLAAGLVAIVATLIAQSFV
ncbi:MAG: hypothetical protein V3S38_07205 [Acidimicrobiia bacterium]